MKFLSCLGCIALSGALFVAARPATAIPAVGVTTNDSLIGFDTATPATLTFGPTAITGLGAGESLLGLDQRPANGLLYALTKDAANVGRIYTINRTTAAVTLVATLAADPADPTSPYSGLSGTEFGIDFNPVVDRLRVVSDSGQNLRVNVVNGLVLSDGDLNPGTPNLVANAYINSFAGATSTTLYGIDATSRSLVIQNPPNNGTLTTVGPLGPNDFLPIIGFDIAPEANRAFVTLTSPSFPSTSSLYRVDLQTGAAAGIDFIGGGARVRGLTLLPVRAPSVTDATTVEDTQTTSGLVITNNPANGSDVPFYKITGITNGTLFQNDGTTPIANDSFITVSQGAAGLKFTPSSNFNGNASFGVQASTSNSDAGLGGSAITATITVTPANDAPVLQSATFNGAKDQPFNAQLVATDADGDTLSFSTSDTLPAGLTLSSTGLISGTPTAATPVFGTVINVTVSDGQVGPATKPITLIITQGQVAPTITSVSPQNGTDKVGAKRTFVLTASDGNGASDIDSVWLLINTRLNWGEGAALIYVPNASSPTDGLLYLRQGDAFLPPIQIGAGASSSAVLDNGAVRVVGSQVTVSVAGGGNTLTLSIPATIRDGLVGQNTLFTRVQDRAGATDPAALADDMGFVRSGTYTVTSQFATGTNSAPILSKLTPGVTNTTLNGSGVAPAAQNFTFYVRDENGTGDIEGVWFLAGKQLNWTGSATFVYQPRTRRLFLRSDDGSTFLGGGQVGSTGILENSQVRLDLSKVQVLPFANGKIFGLRLPLQAKSGLLGQNKVWLRAQDNQNAVAPNSKAQGFVLSGTWNVVQSTTPLGAPNPSNGSS